MANLTVPHSTGSRVLAALGLPHPPESNPSKQDAPFFSPPGSDPIDQVLKTPEIVNSDAQKLFKTLSGKPDEQEKNKRQAAAPAPQRPSPESSYSALLGSKSGSSSSSASTSSLSASSSSSSLSNPPSASAAGVNASALRTPSSPHLNSRSSSEWTASKAFTTIHAASGLGQDPLIEETESISLPTPSRADSTTPAGDDVDNRDVEELGKRLKEVESMHFEPSDSDL